MPWRVSGAQAVPLLLKTANHSDLTLRVGVIRTLGGMGPDAKEAVPLLRETLLANDYPQYKEAGASAAAAAALAKIGKESLTALSAGVKSSHADVRRLAVAALAKVGGDAVPLLVDGLGDTHVDVRRQSAQLLGPMRINDKMVVLGLAYALKDQDEVVRQAAAGGLSILGAGANWRRRNYSMPSRTAMPTSGTPPPTPSATFGRIAPPSSRN